MITLLTIPLTDRTSAFAQAVSTLARVGVNLKALSLNSGSHGQSELQVLANDVAKAAQALNNAGFTVYRQPAVAVEIKDEVGGLAAIIDAVVKANLIATSFFASVTRRADTALALGVFQNNDAAERILTQAGFTIVDRASIQTDESPTGPSPSLDYYLGGTFFW